MPPKRNPKRTKGGSILDVLKWLTPIGPALSPLLAKAVQKGAGVKKRATKKNKKKK